MLNKKNGLGNRKKGNFFPSVSTIRDIIISLFGLDSSFSQRQSFIRINPVPFTIVEHKTFVIHYTTNCCILTAEITIKK